jgi:arsenate reductase (thioredoxin)
MNNQKIKVLFLCKHNKARSQMAEALLKLRGGDRFEVHSAGFNPQPIMPAVVEVIAELGVDISGKQPTNVEDYIGKTYFGYVIIVCNRDELDCPRTFPVPGELLNWEFTDPHGFSGTEEEILEKTRQVRDELDKKIQAWIKTI